MKIPNFLKGWVMSHKCKHKHDKPGVSRRGFLATVSAVPIAGAITCSSAAAPAEKPQDSINLILKVNGRSLPVLVQPRDTLLAVLRDNLGMTGTKPGCERGECGACTVLIEGIPRYACQTLALEAEGHEITTIEGLMQGEELGIVQRAFLEEDALQCGYCTPGQIMAAEGLLRANPNPSLDEIRLGMSGNLCRCGSYDHIFKAVRRAATSRQAGGVK
jgi:xanthine dehydrogenase YagT iron-sulfur-binding subunit